MSNTPENDPKPSAQTANKEQLQASRRELDKALPPEERIKLWWEKNRAALLAGAILALLAVAGFQGLRLYRQAFDTRVQQAWLETQSTEDRRSFAESYSNHPLAGIAWMQLGDDAYQRDDFSQAAGYYRRAVEALVEPVFLGRARLGAAVAALRSGERDQARSALEAVANDPQGLHAIRAEAAYHRAILAIEDGEQETLERYFDLLTTLRFAEGWISRLQEVRAQTNR